MYETFRLELREKKSKSSHGFNPVGDSYTSLVKQWSSWEEIRQNT